MSYAQGNLVHVSAIFKNSAGTKTDPVVVKCSVRDPSNTTTTYVFGDDEEVVRDGTGRYSMNIDADTAGTWYYRWWSTGGGQAAAEGEFTVNAAHAV